MKSFKHFFKESVDSPYPQYNIPRDKATPEEWRATVRDAKKRYHSDPKLKLGQKTNKGEVVNLYYLRTSLEPIYLVKSPDGKMKDYYEGELI